MSKFKAVVLLIFLFLTGAAEANILYTRSSGDLRLIGDYACFKYTGETEFVHTEVYYSMLRNQLAFQPDTMGYFATLNMYVEIKNDSGIVIDSSSWTVGNRIKSISDADVTNYLINDLIPLQLTPGTYQVFIEAKDVKSGIEGQLFIDIDVPEFSSEKLSISQIELVYEITEKDGGSFDKAGKKLIPNTRGNFSRDDDFLYFYAEAYNLDTSEAEYTVDITILDGNGVTYKELPPMTQTVTAGSEAVLNGFDVSDFKVGQYTLQLAVNSRGERVQAEKTFLVTPGKYDWLIAQQERELADFPEAQKITTEEEAKNFHNQILYIASREELKQYDALPLKAKNRFAEAFWQRRDPTPETPFNEYKIDHYSRLRYVNEAFSTFRSGDAKKNGWRSDRGRVYIEYGPPDDIENHPSSLEELPWIEWFYDDVDGGSEFIFLDDSGYGNYNLIHSTAKGEHQDDDWEDKISPASAY